LSLAQICLSLFSDQYPEGVLVCKTKLPFNLPRIFEKIRKNDRSGRAVMRPTKLGPRPRVKAGASRPGAAAKKNEKEAQCLQLRWKLVCWRRWCKMKHTLPATPAQCLARRRRFGWGAGMLT